MSLSKYLALVAASSALAACGTGTVKTLGFQARDAVFVTGTRAAATDGNYQLPQLTLTALVLSSSADICGDYNQNVTRGSEQGLTFTLFTTDSNDTVARNVAYSADYNTVTDDYANVFNRIPTPPGSHDLAVGAWSTSDAACNSTNSWPVQLGSVTMEQADQNGAKGSYEVTVNGYQTSGSFSAKACPAMAPAIDLAAVGLGYPLLSSDSVRRPSCQP